MFLLKARKPSPTGSGMTAFKLWLRSAGQNITKLCRIRINKTPPFK